MNVKIWAAGPQGRRAAIGTLALVLCAGMVMAFSGKARACVIHAPNIAGQTVSPNCAPGRPPPPHPFSGTFDTANVAGTGYPATQNINSQIAPQNTSLNSFPSTYNVATRTAQLWLPHTYLRSKVITQGGKHYLQVYAYTQSQYAPDGDSGTFVYDENGNLVSGSPAALNRLRNEIMEADPIASHWWNTVGKWFKHHARQIFGCTAVVGAAGLSATIGLVSFGGGIVVGLIFDKLLTQETEACF